MEENKQEQTADQEINDEEVKEQQSPKGEENLVELEKLTKEKDEVFNRLQRLQADFENFRKRTSKERVELLNSANSDLVSSLLPVLDNFHRALDGQEQTKFTEGIQMILKQFKEILAKEGLQEINSLNQPFDPNFHDAVMQGEEEGVPTNTVVEVFQTGYTFKEKVIRPAMVKVNN